MENRYYRTFIALPAKLDNHLLEAREELVGLLRNERISWVDPSRFHVTLRFLGDTAAEDIENICRSLDSRVSIPEKKAISLTGLGSFGPRKRPRVIWLGFVETHLFRELHSGVRRALGACGIPENEEPFNAHLTLGRIRSLNNPDHFYRTLDELNSRFRDEIVFERLIFYRSQPGRDGPVYTPMHVLEFGG